MNTSIDKVKFFQEDILRGLNKERSNHHDSYALWYDELSEVRRFFYSLAVEKRPSYGSPYVYNSHRFDHHVNGYFAPLDFFRKGFGGKICTPAQQLTLLSQQFASKNIRFIYVALPCKKAVYPELLLPSHLIPEDRNIIPQWRKMIYDMMENGVETIDIYPYFKQYSSNNHLFSYGHDISVTGASLIGNIVGTYLAETTKDLSFPGMDQFEFRNGSIKEDGLPLEMSQVLLNSRVYLGNECRSEIGVFGNCNLQKYHSLGVDITSHIAASLGYPVNYLGRMLPFSPEEGPDKAPDHCFHGKKVILYVGFPSAAYVRATDHLSTWAVEDISDKSF